LLLRFGEVHVTDHEFQRGDAVVASGGHFRYVSRNANGTHRIASDTGEFDTATGEDVTLDSQVMAERQATSREIAKLRRDDYVNGELRKIRIARAAALTKAHDEAKAFLLGAGVTVAVSLPLATFMAGLPWGKLGRDGRAIYARLRIAENNMRIDERGDCEHFRRVHRRSVELAIIAGDKIDAGVLVDYPKFHS